MGTKKNDAAQRKGRLAALLLSLAVCLSLAPGAAPAAHADGPAGVSIDAANFPDGNFRSVVAGFDSDGDGYLGEAEIAAVTVINCLGEGIASLEGVEHFTALTELYCGNNQLTSLDVSHNAALEVLECGSNQLTSLDVGHNAALTRLWCHGNRLASLDVSQVPAVRDAVVNGTLHTSNSDYDTYISPQGELNVDKGLTLITDRFAVTFDAGGGSAVAPQEVPGGATAAEPDDPTRDGHTFAGWYADPAFAEAFDFSTPVTADTTLYAKWEEAAPRAWARLGGADRYKTMAAIVAEGFESSEWAVVASGENFPDALAASALAGRLGAPVVLTAPGELSPEAASALEALGVESVCIVGGEPAVSAGVEASIRGMGVSVERAAGPDRQATALAVMSRLGGFDTVVVATGENFPDSLSIAPWCYATGSPIVLAGRDGALTDAAVAAIQASGAANVVVVGSAAVVSDAVASQLGGGFSYTRLAGADRYATSAAVAEWGLEHGASASTSAVATGENFPDALSGAALAGRAGGVVVLARDASSPGVGVLAGHKDSIERGYVFGSAAVVPDSLMRRIAERTGMAYPG